MTVWFKNGSVYGYINVPEYKLTALLSAPSKGHYFYYNIRTSYTYNKIGVLIHLLLKRGNYGINIKNKHKR